MEENTTNIASSAQDVNSPETVEQAPVETTETPEVSKEQEIEKNIRERWKSKYKNDNG